MKILKSGRLARDFKCPICGCEFEAEGNDIKKFVKIVPATANNNYKTTEPLFYYVFCPECDERIIISETNTFKEEKEKDSEEEEEENDEEEEYFKQLFFETKMKKVLKDYLYVKKFF